MGKNISNHANGTMIELKTNQIISKEELDALGIKDTGKRFGEPVYTDAVGFEYLLKPLGNDEYKILAKTTAPRK